VSTVPTTAMMTTRMPRNETATTGRGDGFTVIMVIGIAAGVGALILVALLVGLIVWLTKLLQKKITPTTVSGRPQNSPGIYRAVRGRPPTRFVDNRPWMMDAYRRSFIDNYNYGQYSDCRKCYTPSSYVHKNLYIKNWAPSHAGHHYGVFAAPSYAQKSVPMSSVFF